MAVLVANSLDLFWPIHWGPNRSFNQSPYKNILAGENHIMGLGHFPPNSWPIRSKDVVVAPHLQKPQRISGYAPLIMMVPCLKILCHSAKSRYFVALIRFHSKGSSNRGNIATTVSALRSFWADAKMQQQKRPPGTDKQAITRLLTQEPPSEVCCGCLTNCLGNPHPPFPLDPPPPANTPHLGKTNVICYPRPSLRMTPSWTPSAWASASRLQMFACSVSAWSCFVGALAKLHCRTSFFLSRCLSHIMSHWLNIQTWCGMQIHLARKTPCLN